MEVLNRTSKWGEVRRLACPLRRFPFAAPPNCGGKVVAPATKGGKTPKWYVKYMTRCFSPQIPRFPLRGTPRRGKGCTGQSTDRMLHRYPDRQSAACVIFASYPWTRPAAADTKKRRLLKGAVLLPIIWLFLQELLLFLLYRKISSQSCKHRR